MSVGNAEIHYHQQIFLWADPLGNDILEKIMPNESLVMTDDFDLRNLAAISSFVAFSINAVVAIKHREYVKIV